MKKRIGILVLTLGLMISGVNVKAAEQGNVQEFNKYFDEFFNEVKALQSGESISSLKETVEELIQNVKPEDAKRIINFINEKIDEGKWESEKGIEEAIAEGEKEFGVTLTKEQKDMILSVAAGIKKLGISPDYVMDQATEIYEKYSEELQQEISQNSQEIIEETQDKIKEEIDKSVKDYFSDMVSSVKSFFKDILSK